MTPAEHARLDEATVWLLERTSWRDPRDYLVDCALCGLPFWAHGHSAVYCSERCRQFAYYDRQRLGIKRRRIARWRTGRAA